MELESNLNNAYLAAYRIACENLRKMDPVEISLNTNSFYNKEKGTLKLKYLDQEYIVDCTSGDVAAKDNSNSLTATVKVLILHYLLNAKIKPLTGNLISFKEIPGGGAIYYSTFQKRAINPLVKTFSENIEGFYSAIDKLSGFKEKYGNASATINIFPLVPVTYVLWLGDEEFPASGTILFDSTVASFLPGEDIVLAASFGVYELMRLVQD